MFGPDSAIGTVTKQSNHMIADIGKKIEAKSLFKKELLINLIERGYSFPEDHRDIMWRYVTRVPMNEAQFNTLASQPVHPSIRLLPNSLPIRFRSVSHRLMRILSALVYWHPPLAECDWLPALIYPFLVVFGRDKLCTFEVIMTVITNWCQEWMHFIPNPPITIISRIDALAKQHGGEAPLHRSWSALRSFFGEVATTEVAKMLIDNILSCKPVFLEYLVVSYCLLEEGRYVDEFNYKFVINRARKLFEKDYKRSPNQNKFIPLPSGHYPILPIVVKSHMWRIKELHRIRAEAEQAKQQAKLVKEIEEESAKIKMQKRSWIAERAFLRDVESDQMEEFKRREREAMLREAIEEERSLNKRRENMNQRKIQGENATTEWKKDIERVQDETRQVVETRKEAWDRWLKLKEEEALLTKQEVETELSLLNEREMVFSDIVESNKQTLNEAAATEREILNDSLHRVQELEDGKNEYIKILERARRNHMSPFSFSKQKV